jgi:hypothetical protein
MSEMLRAGRGGECARLASARRSSEAVFPVHASC